MLGTAIVLKQVDLTDAGTLSDGASGRYQVAPVARGLHQLPQCHEPPCHALAYAEARWARGCSEPGSWRWAVCLRACTSSTPRRVHPVMKRPLRWPHPRAPRPRPSPQAGRQQSWRASIRRISTRIQALGPNRHTAATASWAAARPVMTALASTTTDARGIINSPTVRLLSNFNGVVWAIAFLIYCSRRVQRPTTTV